jgi:NADH:ubiquinone oxidoreductase subunit K
MTSITIDHFLFLGAILFTIGVLGILNKIAPRKRKWSIVILVIFLLSI